MDLNSSMLLLGFALGLLHALDADHIMAVTMLSQRSSANDARRSTREVLSFCVRWALGHGGVLVILALSFLVLEARLPEAVSMFAEKAVGMFLIAIGIWLIWHLVYRRVKIDLHRHGELTHVHLVESGHRHTRHQPVLVGILHGVAGSAPFLALIPATGTLSVLSGVLYVGLFSLGVLASMCVFGLMLSRFQNWLVTLGQSVYQGLRWLLALSSIGFGSFWLLSSG
ncbi:MAG: sulfite exporter TauE/SafE family protein [Pseudomonadota bacterium]